VDFGKGYDVILLTNFLHHFDAAGCETLLKKVHAALRDGGKAVALEFIPDENRIAPVDAAVFALTMLATTPAGDAYTFSEYERMFRNAGFSQSALHPLPPTMQRVVIASK
jgi:cyclopropane fatty-acyl-phospholipid synthase-like methyltransferase